MLLECRISREAEDDILSSIKWYEEQHAGLGIQFIEELEHARNAIRENPEAYAIRYKGIVRGYVVNRFPFLVLYVVSKQTIDVLAVFHTRQHPEKWKNRLEK